MVTDVFFPPRDRITMQWGLVALYLLQDWKRVANAQRSAPSPEWFRPHGVVNGITGENRKTVLRLARLACCIECEATLPADSTGDHVIALANGGPGGVENYLPLCGRCNSSKGTRDLLAWWSERRGRRPRELPCDVLASYARLAFRDAQRRRALGDSIPGPLLAAVTDLLALLPAVEHQRMVWSRVAWVAGYSKSDLNGERKFND